MNTNNFPHLLAILADGQWHSGQELAQTLNVSRTAIWKQLAKFADFNLHVESLKGKGYRLAWRIELLNADKINSELSAQAKALFLTPEILLITNSTNTQALQNLRTGYICLAEMQTAGRGRRGRAWQTPFASQVALSLVYEFEGGIADMQGLSLVVGICMIRALKNSAAKHDNVHKIKLKWPNDILFENKKLGGILLEVNGDLAGPCRVVIGLGLNNDLEIVAASSGLKNQCEHNKIDQPYTDLRSILNIAADRNRLAALILNELAMVLADYAQIGFAYYRKEWMDLDAFYKLPVTVSLGDQSIKGVAHGVDERAQLIVETAEGMNYFNSGEVSVRLESS